MNATSSFLAISYEWSLVPREVRDFDLVLILCSCTGRTDDTGLLQEHDPEVRVYHAKLPEKNMRHELSDVSGCLGLLHPVADEHAERKAAAIERLVSDVILWRLAEERFPAVEKTLVLLQGPMLPKLRGRLMYRGISDQVIFCALTHQPDWFQRVEAAEQSYEVLRQTARTGLGAVYPPRALDRGTRSWVYRSSGGGPMHFEVVTNMHDCVFPTRDWLAEIQGDVEQLVSPKLIDRSYPTARTLPSPLSNATRKAEDVRQREALFISFLLALRGADYDLTKLDGISAYDRILKSLRAVRLTSVGGELRLKDCLGQEKEEELYALFKRAWPLQEAQQADDVFEMPVGRAQIRDWIYVESEILQPNVRRQLITEDIDSIADVLDRCVAAHGRAVFDDFRLRVRNESSLMWNDVRRGRILNTLKRKWSFPDSNATDVGER